MRRVAHGFTTLAVCFIACVAGCDAPSKEPAQTTAVPSAPALPAATSSGQGPADADAPAEFTATASGLKYKVLRKSAGKMPTAADSVKVHYRGWLDDGQEFDSSYKRNEPISFPLRGVVAGWTEGLQLIGEGGMIELEIPSDLGYGPEGRPGIPPNATLHFIVELLEVQ